MFMDPDTGVGLDLAAQIIQQVNRQQQQQLKITTNIAKKSKISEYALRNMLHTGMEVRIRNFLQELTFCERPKLI